MSLSYWGCPCLTGGVFVLLEVTLSYWSVLYLTGGVFVLLKVCTDGQAGGRRAALFLIPWSGVLVLLEVS